jgi:PAS domain S-box-containing protein
MRFVAWEGLSEGYRQAVEGHSPWTRETEDPQPVLVEDVRDEPGLAALEQVIEDEGIRSLAFIPLVADRRLLGKFMLYYSRPHEFREDEVLLAQTIACQVAFAIDQHNARRVLRESEQQYRELIQGIAQAVYTTDADGHVLLYNEAAVELWGRRPEVGKDMWYGSLRIYGTDGEPMALEDCPMAIALKENRPVRGVEIVIERPDGTRSSVLPSPTPILDSYGRLVGAINVLFDITNRKKEEDRLALYAEIFANSKDGIAIIDPAGKYLEQNSAHEELLGFGSDEIIDQTPAIHLGEATFAEIATALTQSGVYRGEVDSVAKDGRELTLDLSAFVVKDKAGEPRYFVGIKRDVTERRLAEEALRRSGEMREQFLSLVSHELRTPISTVLGNGLLLLKHSEQIDEADKRQAYADIVTQTEKLQENIEHLLLLARLDASELELEPISLRALAAKGIETFKERHPDRVLTFRSPDDLPAVLGQETLVSLVLQNLLTNAEKYSPAGQPIDVSLQETEPGLVEVRVRDYGIGLDEHDVKNLFTPFYRADKAKQQAPGLGIGLAVCKRVLEAQDGTIGAAGRRDGSDFFFSLKQVAV